MTGAVFRVGGDLRQPPASGHRRSADTAVHRQRARWARAAEEVELHRSRLLFIPCMHSSQSGRWSCGRPTRFGPADGLFASVLRTAYWLRPCETGEAPNRRGSAGASPYQSIRYSMFYIDNSQSNGRANLPVSRGGSNNPCYHRAFNASIGRRPDEGHRATEWDRTTTASTGPRHRILATRRGLRLWRQAGRFRSSPRDCPAPAG